MKKNLIVMALLTATSGVAMAQSNVEVYGVVDMGIQSYDNGVNRVNGIESGLANGSKLGFKGVENLGNGLKAGFQLETGIAADEGKESKFTGNWGDGTFVYLQGDSWGKVTMGRQFTPLRQSLNVVDPFVTSYAGDARTMIGAGLAGGFPTRASNSISYATNTYSGFNASVAMAAGEKAGDNSAGRALGFNLNYNQGPVAATLAYHKANSSETNGVFTGDTTSTLLGGSYDFGVAKAHVGFGNSSQESAPGVKAKKRNYLVGVSAPVGSAGRVMASYIINDVRSFDNADSEQFAVGYTHHLSKRTNLYGMYSHISNDANASVGAGAAGKNATKFQAGIRHAF